MSEPMSNRKNPKSGRLRVKEEGQIRKFAKIKIFKGVIDSKRRRKENSPNMKIFSLARIDTGSDEEEKEEIGEAEECDARSINDHNIKITFDFIFCATQ